MSYSNIIANTQTQAHSIVPVSEESVPSSFVEKLSHAKGTGFTGTAIKKVAGFIGMDEAALGLEPHAAVHPGSLSVDLELEVQAWRQAAKRTAALEDSEMLRRLTNPDQEMKRKVLAIFTTRTIQNGLSTKPTHVRTRPESRRWLQYMRRSIAVIEEDTRRHRMEDKTGELLRRELAKEVTYKVLPGLQVPELRSTKHLINAPWPVAYDSGLKIFGGAAFSATRNLAESAATSAYQLADFAFRVGKFFGPKAAAKGSELTTKVAAKGSDLTVKAVVTGKNLGAQALATGHVVGHEATVVAQQLGHTALVKTQSLGHQAVSGAKTLSHKASVGAHDVAQHVTDVAVDTALGAQHMVGQAAQTVKDVKDQTQAAAANAVHAIQDLMTTPEPTLSWTDLDALEEDERSTRNSDNFNPLRLMLAMRTSSIIRDVSTLYPMGNPAYGMRVFEEMERYERLNGDQTNARVNANRAASIISTHRRNLAWEASQQRAPIQEALSMAINSNPVFASSMILPHASSQRLSTEAPRLETFRDAYRQPAVSGVLPAYSAPVSNPAVQAASLQSPFVSQSSIDLFAKAFQSAPAHVYRPAM